MLEPTRGHRHHRALFAVAPLVLGACAEATVAPAGRVELRGAAAPGAACEAPGELQLTGIDARASLVVSGADLCAAAPRHHELPPGRYVLTWRGVDASAALAPGMPPPLQELAVLSLLPGQLTRVRVQLEPLGASPAGLASSQASAARVPSACSHDDAVRSGAS